MKNGTGLSANFHNPQDLVLDSVGNLYISDGDNNVIRKIDLFRNVSTLAGSGKAGFKDGQRMQAQFNFPGGIALDSQGNLYVADTGNNRIRKIDVNGNVSTFAGSGNPGFKDGPSGQAEFKKPGGLAFDVRGYLYVSDIENHCVRKIDTNGNVTTFAGSGVLGFKDAQGKQAQFFVPSGMVTDGRGNLYVADGGNHRIRKIDTIGNVTTFAGSGVRGSVDGDLLKASFGTLMLFALNPSHQTLYISDVIHHKIRKVTIP